MVIIVAVLWGGGVGAVFGPPCVFDRLLEWMTGEAGACMTACAIYAAQYCCDVQSNQSTETLKSSSSTPNYAVDRATSAEASYQRLRFSPKAPGYAHDLWRPGTLTNNLAFKTETKDVDFSRWDNRGPRPRTASLPASLFKKTLFRQKQRCLSRKRL